MTLLILAAGMGSRYGGMKQIDPVGPSGEFIIDYSCHDAIKAGIDKIVFVIKRENLEIFRSTVGARVEGRADVEYVFQEASDLPEGYSVPQGRVKPWGTAHALLAAKKAINDNFIVINADDFYGAETFATIANYLRDSEPYAIPMRLCMAGYKLCNTLTENGTVSRGICDVDRNGMLGSIVEHTAVRPVSGGAETFVDGEFRPIAPDSVASMNCFGLTPAIFPFVEEEFVRFLCNMRDPLKDEFYLPFAVGAAQKAGAASVKVCPTEAKWHGVTYSADKPAVKESILALVAAGEYPERLWGDGQ